MPRIKLFDEQAVLEKAMQLFWKQGYHATSIQDLVDYLGINRASLYDTYGGKKPLFYRAFQHYRQSNVQGISTFLGRHSNVKAGFRAMFQAAIEESVSDKDRKGCFVVNATTELVPGDEELEKILIANKKAFEDVFFEYLSQGAAKGEIPVHKDLKSLASLIFTMYAGIKVVSKVQPDKQALLATVDTALLLLE